MIPKVIHYCWFGGKEKPELVRKCIDSWKKYCPDYEIQEWNEQNWNVNLCQYTKEAYESKKWAFISDVARLEIIYTEGGIYLDTDVELIKSLDSLLVYDLYFGFENPNGINTGIGFGGTKSHYVLKELLYDYLDRPLIYPGQTRIDVCTKIQTSSLRRIFPQLRMDGSHQVYNNVAFLPEDYLNPYTGVTQSSISIHHSALSWMGDKQREMNNTYSKRHSKFAKIVLRFIRNPQYTIWIEKHLGKKIAKVHVFITYDLIDYGVVYFLKKAMMRLKERNKNDT